MSEITVILPAAAALFTLVVAGEYGRAARLPLPEGPGPERDYAMRGMDRLLCWLLTAAYAAVAFYALGNTRAPQSFCRLDGDGASAEIALAEDTDIAGIRWYAGLRTGTWTLEFSEDGETWEQALTLEQNYVSLFKWNDAELPNGPVRAQYIRVTASGAPEMGELALFDRQGGAVAPASVSAAGAALFDEASLVPEASDFLNSTYFDEIYHARTAYEGLRGETIYEVTHPPLGKLIISLGILLFGMTPFGWRFMGTLFGALMLPILYAFVKRIFGRRELAVCCTLIFAFDFMHFVQTRIATIDTYAVFFILLMYYYMYRFVSSREGERHRTLWLALSGLFFGLGAASKWTCIYAGAGLGVIWLLYWIFCSGQMFRRAFWKNAACCLLFFIAVPAAVYYLSYWPYGRAAGLSWPGMLFSREYGQLILDNQQYMWHYHSTLVATHPYSSKWWQWLLDIRPILYYLEYFDDNTKSSIGAFTSPLLCWGGLLAMFAVAWRAAVRRDRRAAFILAGYLAQLLPWVLVTRLTFAYHYFPSEVFLLLALGYLFDGIETRSGKRWPLLAFTAASMGLFALFYPVLSGLRVSRAYCTAALQWMGSWPF